MKRVLDVTEHASILSTFIDIKFPDRNDIILVARDGSRILYELAKAKKKNVAGIILISPMFQPTWIEGIEDIPMLLIWAKEDTVNRFQNSFEVSKYFYDVSTLFFEEGMLPEGVSTKEAHEPEKFKFDAISLRVKEWVTYIRQYKKPLHDS